MNRTHHSAVLPVSTPGFAHEELRVVRGRQTGVTIAVGIHSTAAGPAAGGCRIKSYRGWGDGVEDVLRLSEAMTTKCALAGLPYGGGKIVAIQEGSAAVSRADLITDIADVVASFGGRYITAPDIGTGSDDTAVIHAATGGWAHCRPEAAGGSGDSSAATARGVLASLRAAAEHIFREDSAADLRVGVIGYGHVGRLIAESLAADGADVRVNDANESLRPTVEAAGLTWWPSASLEDDLDILVPAATGGLLTPSTAETCGARLVVGPANNQISDDHVDEILHGRGITWVPDVLASGGGVTYAVSREGLGLDEAESNRRVDSIGQTTAGLFAQMALDDSTPLQAARRLAARRIESAS